VRTPVMLGLTLSLSLNLSLWFRLGRSRRLLICVRVDSLDAYAAARDRGILAEVDTAYVDIHHHSFAFPLSRCSSVGFRVTSCS
jgi:hypothetical protein